MGDLWMSHLFPLNYSINFQKYKVNKRKFIYIKQARSLNMSRTIIIVYLNKQSAT